MVLKVPEKLIIMTTNLLLCYLIIKIGYIDPLLIIKLIFINIKFQISGKARYTYNGLAKPKKKTQPC